MNFDKYKKTRFACYTAYFTMSSVFSLPPLLFVTLRDMYNVSYSLLGTLVLINFCTQLCIDLVFTFFSKYFKVRKIVIIMPIITSAGLFIYALVPTFFPNIAYIGLVIGTVIFSLSAGLSEVLLSPLIAAMPSKNPQKDMSMLHSLYAFGVLSVVVVSTIFFKLFGSENWMYLTVVLAVFPLIAAFLFSTSPIPNMSLSQENGEKRNDSKKNVGLIICAGTIFFGSCAEVAMSNWISSFMESALNIPKTVGDILGMAMFAVLLGIGRISYAKFGKKIIPILLFGMAGSAVCYLVAGLSTNVIFAFIACILTGLFTSMLWPGSLILMEEKIPSSGVAAYALMAASGDLGASVAPQLLGIIIDKVSLSDFALNMGNKLSVTAEQIGMKSGMLLTSIFPILGTVLLVFAVRYFAKSKTENA